MLRLKHSEISLDFYWTVIKEGRALEDLMQPFTSYLHE
jgi:hypothetical protein